MSVPAPPTGYTRYLMKSKLGMGRDFRVLDPATEQDLFLVDGKVGARPKAQILDAAGAVLVEVTGKLLGIPKRMDVTTPDGTQVAHLHSPALKFVRDRYTIDVAEGVEPGLAFSLVWAIDRWVERD